MNPVRVGVVGANPEASWASRSHLPALRALPEYELAAVATTRAETAERSAQIFGAERSFSDARDLIDQPDLDLVVVAVNVPQHAALVGSAFEAGKDVLCEWPLARTTAEARELAAAAERRGCRGWVMLQGRCSPALDELARLVGDGYVGRVTSVLVHSTTGLWGGSEVRPGSRYQLDPANGADLLAITGGHALDAVCNALGGLEWVSTHSSVQQRSVRVTGSDEVVEPGVPDHLTITGELTGGAVFGFHLHNGQPWGASTSMEVVGTQGVLTLRAPEDPPPGLHRSQLVLRGARHDGDTSPQVLPVPGPELDLPEPALNVARYYRSLAELLRSGGDAGRVAGRVAGFADAVRLHGTLDAIRAAEAPRRALTDDVS